MRESSLYRFVVWVVCILIAAWSCPAYASHPAEGYPLFYSQGAEVGTRPTDWSTGDLIFSGDLGLVEDLTWAEQYIINGLDPAKVPDGVDCTPWAILIMNAARKIDELYGYIPVQLTKDELLKIPQCEYWPEEQFEYYKSPLTGDWPFLQQESFSTGDLYMRKLSEQEIEHFANLDGHLYQLWIEGYDRPFQADEEVPTKMCGAIYYARVYGLNQPLFEGFDYIVTFR